MKGVTHLVSLDVEGAIADVRRVFEGVLDEGVDGLEAHVLDRLVRAEAQPQEAPRRRDDRREVVAAIFA